MVVNDLGGTAEGHGADSGPAAEVVEHIVASGGAAVADGSDIATEDGARTVIETALSSFGRIDVLINNAGIIEWAGFPEADVDNLSRHLAVHTVGSFNTARAAWPHMCGQEYGRIVMTTSSGVFGLPTNTSYATAKGGVIGLARSLATAGRRLGITVNLIAPAAMTRMAGGGDAAQSAAMAPELVAPMAAYLAHESCPVTGEMYAAGAGRFARVFIASTPGYVHEGAEPSMEDIAAHWAAINDETGYSVPRYLGAWSKVFLDHLDAGES